VQIREQLKNYYADVEKQITRAFPERLVFLRVVDNKVVLGGHARNTGELAQILCIPQLAGAMLPLPEPSGISPPRTQLPTTVPSEEELSGLPAPLPVDVRDGDTRRIPGWFTDSDNAPNRRVLSYLVQAPIDPHSQVQIREQLKNYYADVETQITRAFPESLVFLRVVGNKVVLGGQARDTDELAQILWIVARCAASQIRVGWPGATVVEQGVTQAKITKLP
jgi:hypothetical protein